MGTARLLVISNGHGEDSIGAAIIRRLPSSLKVEAYPTLGDGNAYRDVCDIVGPRAALPSEGWRNVKGSIARDAMGGGIATLWPGLKFFRAARDLYDKVLVVGDMIGIYGCWLTGHRGVVYLDVYKTGFGGSYLRIDKLMLRRTAKTVFCRADNLAASLRAAGIDARAPGNVMMDTIPRTGQVMPRHKPKAVTMLPGSRAHALRNFSMQVEAVRQLPADEVPDLFLAHANSIPLEMLAEAGGLRIGNGTLDDDRFRISVVPGNAMGDALDVSDFVLSQAGTATIQSIGLGKPSITFQSPEDRPSRFRDEQRLFAEARHVVPADPIALGAAMRHWLGDPAEVARRGAIGRERIGPPGAIDAIVAELTR